VKHLPPALVSLAQNQAGLLSRQQLAEHDFTRHDITRRVRLGYWSEVTTRVVSTGPQIRLRNADRWAASLHFPDAALTGMAALELHGFPAEAGKHVDMVSASNIRITPLPIIRMHFRSAVSIHSIEPAAISPASATIDAMRLAKSLRQSTFFGVWALQQRLVTIDSLIEEYHRTKTINKSQLVARTLSTLDVGIEAMSEWDFAQLCTRFGIVQPSRQARRADSDGKSRYLDAYWELPNRKLIVELDGRGHLDFEVRQDDMYRDNEMLIQGFITLRIPAVAFRLDPARWMRQIQKALS
jgi:hypothetical protein